MTIERKKQIAIFMNYPTVLTAGRITDSLADKMYNDYNSLMAVINKIENTRVNGMEDINVYSKDANIVPVEWQFKVSIENGQCTIDRDVMPQYHGTEEDFLKLYDCRKKNKLKSIQEAIIKFIIWFNKTTKN